MDACPHCGYYPDPGVGEAHSQNCPVLTEPHAIVRELARRGPWFDAGAFCVTCPDLGEPTIWDEASFSSDPEKHHPSCLWRRARVLYP